MVEGSQDVLGHLQVARLGGRQFVATVHHSLGHLSGAVQVLHPQLGVQPFLQLQQVVLTLARQALGFLQVQGQPC